MEDIKGGGAELLEEKNQLLQAILDCTSKNVYTITTNNHNNLKAIERASQNLCFERGGSDSLTAHLSDNPLVRRHISPTTH